MKTETIRARVSTELVQALDTEAHRRMVRRSDLVRWALWRMCKEIPETDKVGRKRPTEQQA